MAFLINIYLKVYTFVLSIQKIKPDFWLGIQILILLFATILLFLKSMVLIKFPMLLLALWLVLKSAFIPPDNYYPVLNVGGFVITTRVFTVIVFMFYVAFIFHEIPRTLCTNESEALTPHGHYEGKSDFESGTRAISSLAEASPITTSVVVTTVVTGVATGLTHGIVSSANIGRLVTPVLRNVSSETIVPQGDIIVAESIFAFEIGTVCGLITGCLTSLFTRRARSVLPTDNSQPIVIQPTEGESPELSRIHEQILAEANLRTVQTIGHDPRLLELSTTGMLHAYQNNTALENLNTVSEQGDINVGLLLSGHRNAAVLEGRRLGVESTLDELLNSESVKLDVSAVLNNDSKPQSGALVNLFSGLTE